jgi:hypothetical protein
MKKWQAKKDNNHNPLKSHFQEVGFAFEDTHHVHDGFPDGVISTFNGLTIFTLDPDRVRAILEAAGIDCVILDGASRMIEFKNPETDHWLTEDQVPFHEKHPVTIVQTSAEVDQLAKFRIEEGA